MSTSRRRTLAVRRAACGMADVSGTSAGDPDRGAAT